MRFLLDTNVLSEPTKPTPNPHVVARLMAHRHECGVAALSWHELWYGTLRLPPSRRRHGLERYLHDGIAQVMPLLPYDEHAARWHATERARLTAAGRRPAFIDGQIAAIAATRGLTLVTANLRDFRDFDGLALTDWSSPS